MANRRSTGDEVQPMYIYNIPYSRRRALQQILDVGEHWKDLAASLDWSTDKVHSLSFAFQRPNGSPTDTLLLEWSHSNATVEMLVFHLMKLKLIRAANLFRGLVPDAMLVEENAFTNNIPNSTVNGNNGVVDASGLPLPPLPTVTHSPASLNKLTPESSIVSSVSDDSRYDNASDASVKYLHSDVGPDTPVKTLHGNGPPSRRPEPVESLDVTTRVVRPLPCSIISENLMERAWTDLAPDVPSTVRQYALSDIVAATDNFSNHHTVGCGNFGAVYKCRISDKLLAIKRMYKVTAGYQDVAAEINILHKFHHKNLCVLYGCSIDGPDVCLIYEFMVNGSLLDRLRCKNGTPVLSWEQRLNILYDAASGLHHLHTGLKQPVIHGDMKSSNILLGVNFEAKIADFGLSRKAMEGDVAGVYTHRTTLEQRTELLETYAYLPSEFLAGNGRYGLPSDIYSFGVVIYELCTGLKVYDTSRKNGALLVDLVSGFHGKNDEDWLLKLKDYHVCGWPNSLWLKTLSTGSKCTTLRRKDQPSMTEVLRELTQASQICQPSNICNPLNTVVPSHTYPPSPIGSQSKPFVDREENEMVRKKTKEVPSFLRNIFDNAESPTIPCTRQSMPPCQQPKLPANHLPFASHPVGNTRSAVPTLATEDLERVARLENLIASHNVH